MQLSLRGAAHQAGVAKSTILRAIKAGRLSATRSDDGGYLIDPSEVLRVYPADRPTPRPTPRIAAQSTAVPEAVDPVATLLRNASIEAELKAAREMLDVERRRSDEWRAQCERWQEEAGQWRNQAERLLLVAPLVTPPPTPPATGLRTNPVATPAPDVTGSPATVVSPRRRWWWQRRQAS